MGLNWKHFFLFAYFICLTDKIRGNEILTHKKESRIIGGQESLAGQHPFAVAINVQTSDSTFFCGGSVYDVYWVLTAGTCVYNGILFTVHEGSHLLVGGDSNRVTVAASEYIIHPGFNPFTIENDIGLIRLRLPVGYTNYIRPIYVPSQNVESGDSVMSLGWGQTSDFDAGLSNTLRYVTLSALSNEECRLVYGNQITDNMLCAAGNYNEGTCIGDNGGALFQTDTYGIHYIVGIASFISGNGCESTDPSGFTRVLPYADWLQSTTSTK